MGANYNPPTNLYKICEISHWQNKKKSFLYLRLLVIVASRFVRRLLTVVLRDVSLYRRNKAVIVPVKSTVTALNT